MSNGTPAANPYKDDFKFVRPSDWAKPLPESEIKKGFASAIDELQAFGGGVVGLAGQAAASVLPEIARPVAEDVRDWGLETYQKNIDESTAGWQKPKIAKIEDIKLGEEGGTDRLSDWAQYHGAKGIGTLASLVFSGGVGGALAKVATKQAVKNIAKEQVGKKLLGKVVTQEIKDKKKEQIKRNVTRGVIAGGATGAFALEGGGAFGQQTGEGVAPQDALLPSVGVAAINTALELVAPLSVAKKLGLGSWVTKGLGKQLKDDPIGLGKKAQRLASKILKGVGTTAAQEGITEGIQELVQLAGSRIAKDEELLAELSDEDRSQILNAAAAGGLTGGLFGGAAGPFTKAQRGQIESETKKKTAPEASQEEIEKVSAGSEIGEVAQPGVQGDLTSAQLNNGVGAQLNNVVGEGIVPETTIEEQVNAEEIRADQDSLREEAQIGEGVQDTSGQNREQLEEEGRPETGAVSQEKPLESREGVVAKTVEQVEQDTNKELGKGWINRAKKLGIFEVKDEVGPNGQSAQYDPEIGKITVYAKSLDEGSSAAQVLHEASHATMDSLTQGKVGQFAQEISDQAFAGKNEVAQKATMQGRAAELAWKAKQFGIEHNLWNTEGATQQEEWKRVEGEVRKAIEGLSQQERAAFAEKANRILTEEIFAYFVQYAHGAKKASGVFRRGINSIKAGLLSSDFGRAFSKVGLKPKINDEVAVELARRSSQYAIELREELNNLETSKVTQPGVKSIIDEPPPKLGIPVGVNPFTGANLDTQSDRVAELPLESQPNIESSKERFAAAEQASREYPGGLTLSYKWGSTYDDQGKRSEGEYDTQVSPANFEVLSQAIRSATSLFVLGKIKLNVSFADPDWFESYGEISTKVNSDHSVEADVTFNIQTFVDGFDSKHGLQQLIDTVVHELCHTRQRLDSRLKDFDVTESAETEELIYSGIFDGNLYQGNYWNAPWEIEARRVAKNNKWKVLDDLKSQKLLTKFESERSSDAVLESRGEILDKALHTDKPALDRMSDALELDNTMESRPPILTGDYWFTDPVAKEVDIAYGAGRGDKFLWNVLDMFQPLQKKARELYDLFDLSKTRKSAEQTRYREDYHKPLIDLVSGYAAKWKKKGEQRDHTWVDDHLAAAHIVIDDVNMAMGEDNAASYAKKLEEKLVDLETEIVNPETGKNNKVGSLFKKQVANVKAGLRAEGTDRDGNKVEDKKGEGVKRLKGGEIKKEMRDLVDRFMEYEPVVENVQDLRVEWEGLKRHGGGMSTGTKPTKWANRRDSLLEKHAQTLATQAGGTEMLDANELYVDIKDDEDFHSIQNLINQAAQEKLRVLAEGEDSAIITSAEYEKLKNSKQFYVPLRREGFAFEHGSELAGLLQTGRGGGKQLGGHRAGTAETFARKPVYIMQNLLASLDASKAASERNNVLNEMYKLEQANGLEGWFTTVDKEEYVGRDELGFIKESASTQWEPSDIHFIRKGKHLVLRPNHENQKAMQISRAINNLDAKEIGGVLKGFQHVNNWIRNVNIAFSPLFLVKNAIKDPLTAAYNLKASEAEPYVKSIFGEYKNSLRALWKVHMAKDKLRDVNDPDYQKVHAFERAGGRTSFVLSLQEMSDQADSFNGQLRRAMGEVKIPGLGINVSSPKVGQMFQVAKKGAAWIENLNIVMENVMRLSAYTVLTKPKDQGGAGLSSVKAARIAKDMTTNFSRKGNKTQALSAWWLFFNPAVQGNYQVWQNLTSEKNSKVLQKMVVGTVAFSFMLDQMGRMMSGDEDGDGKSDWDSLSQRDKEQYIHLPFPIPGTGGHYPKIPAPWVFNVFWRAGQMLSEATTEHRKVESLAVDIPALALATFNPLGNPPTAAQAITPTALDPLMQIVENRGAFGTPIGPEQYPGAGWKPKSELAFSSTPQQYKDVARTLNKITGGSAAEAGLVDLRPGDVQLLTNFVMGSLGRFIGDTIEAGTGQAKKLTDIPGVKLFASEPSDPMSSQLYHERVAKVFAAKKLEKMYQAGDQRDVTELQKVRQGRAGELRMGSMAKDVERQIKDLRSQLRTAQNLEQDSRVDMLKKRIENTQERFNKAWARRVGN